MFNSNESVFINPLSACTICHELDLSVKALKMVNDNMAKGWFIFQMDKSLVVHIIMELQNNVHQLVNLRLELNTWRVTCLIVVGKTFVLFDSGQ